MGSFSRKILSKSLIFAGLTSGAVLTAGLSTSMLNAQSNPAIPGTQNPAAVQSGSYSADPSHTLVGWSINHFGFNDYFGQFGDVEGSLILDRSNLAGTSVDVRIPLQSVAVVSQQLKAHLFAPGKNGGKPDFFGPNPADARFISETVQQTGPSTAIINGTLTLNGVSHPVALNTRFTGGGVNPINSAQTVGFEARASIKRSDFGLTYGLPALGDQVDLVISAAFEQTDGNLTNKPGVNGSGQAFSPRDIPCGANKVRQYVGQKSTPALRSTIAKQSGADSLRWVTPGQPVTLDFRPDRLNVTYDPQRNVITEVHCG